MGARWAALLVVAAVAAGTAGCGSGEDGTELEKIAFVAPGSDNEPDWTLQSRMIVEEFPEAFGIRVDTIDASQAGDLRAAFEQVAGEGNQLVIAHDSRYADVAAQVAEDSGVSTLVWGDRPDDDAPVAGITVQDKEGGYMAGIIATMAAITRRLGIVVAADGSDWDLETWNRTAGGFVAGAYSADPNVTVTYIQVGGDGDAVTVDEMHDATRQLQNRGAQMIFALGGQATVGALRAIEEKGGENQFVGVVGDKAVYNRDNFVLTSIMWETRDIFRQALRDVRAGTFGDDPYRLTLRDRGIWLLNTGRTPSDAYEEALRAQEGMEAGTIDVPVTPTSDGVEQLIAGDGQG